MRYMATQYGRVMVECSVKTWSTGEGNGKPLQYSCLENPMNSMKKQKDRTLKVNSPGQWVPNMLLEISGEITPERMKGCSQSKNRVILKEISLEYSLEGLMVNLKLQYFGHLMRRTDSFEETLMLGEIGGGKRRG